MNIAVEGKWGKIGVIGPRSCTFDFVRKIVAKQHGGTLGSLLYRDDRW